MTAAPAFTVDALLLVERNKGGLRKRLNRNGFGYCMPQVIDDVDNGLDGKREDHIDHDLLGLCGGSQPAEREHEEAVYDLLQHLPPVLW